MPLLFKRIAAGLSGILLALAAAEGLLRIFYNPPPVVSGWVCSASVPPQERNQIGFRGHRIEYGDSTIVIALLGDSQVEAVHLAWGWMPEQRLEHYLEELLDRDVEVVSLASQGYGQDQELLALVHYFRFFRADLVLVWETPANDLWNNTFPTHWPANGWAKPTFRLVDGRLSGPSENMGDTLPRPSSRLALLLESVFRPADRDGEWEAFLPPAYQPDTVWTVGYLTDWQERYDANLGLMRDENLATEKSHLSIYLTPESPRTAYSVELTRLLLDSIQAVALAHGAGMAAFAVAGAPDPTGDVVSATYMLEGRYYHVSRDQYESCVSRMNEGLRFYSIPLRVDDWKMGPLNSHLNEHATDALMEDLARLIAPGLESQRTDTQPSVRRGPD